MRRDHHIAICILLLLHSGADAHPGGLDAQGGHKDHRTGGYHFHGGQPAPVFTPSPSRQMPVARQTAPVKPRMQPRTTARTADRRSELNKKFGNPIPSNGTESQAPPADETREETAARKLREAKELAKQKSFERALRLVAEILDLYAETHAATEATTLQPEYEEGVATSKLRLAIVFVDREKNADASVRLKEIVRMYPETKAAKDAKWYLTKLGTK